VKKISSVMHANFRRMIDDMADPQEKEVSKAMLVLVTARDLGPDPAQLVQKTGYPEEFIAEIVSRMREAHLWGDMIDDREWWDRHGDLSGPGLLSHAGVALGQLQRIETATGCIYRDNETGEVVHEWRDPKPVSIM
jgi:hypothetical protein